MKTVIGAMAGLSGGVAWAIGANTEEPLTILQIIAAFVIVLLVVNSDDR